MIACFLKSRFTVLAHAGEEIGWVGEESGVSCLLSREVPFFKAAHECLQRSYGRGVEGAGSKTSSARGSWRKPSIWDTTFIVTYRRRHEADSQMAERRGDGGNAAPWGADYVDANIGTAALPKVRLIFADLKREF